MAYVRGVAPVGVRSQKPRPSRTRGMHYAERDGAFAQQLGTVGAAIRRALPRNPTAVYAKKGHHRIEKCNGQSGTPSDLEVFCPDYGISKKNYYPTIRVSFSLLDKNW
jgi:hypothetical protein